MQHIPELSGWKAIGDYLGVSVRTAQDYEKKFGLPVRHMQGERGRVFAHPADLDAWRKSHTALLDKRTPPGDVDERTTVDGETSELAAVADTLHQEQAADLLTPADSGVSRPAPPRRNWLKAAIVVSAILILSTIFVYTRTSQRLEPSATKIMGRTLVVLDPGDRPLWQYVLPGKPEEPYNFAQPKRVFADIDGDGTKELLFPFRDLDHPDGPDTLYCFDAAGRVRWKRQMGRDLRTVSSTSIYPAHYNFVWVGALKRATPQGGAIVLGGRRGGTYLFGVELLNKDGQPVGGDYYHPGWLWAMGTMDLNGDGYDEIIMGGINNLYRDLPEFGYAMTLIVLDSKNVAGQGPIPPGDERRLAGLAPGAEKAVLFLPDFAKAPPQRPERFCLISAIQPLIDSFHVRALFNDGTQDTTVDYDFDRHLTITQAQPSPFTKQILDAKLPKASTPTQRSQFYKEHLGKIYVLKNELAVPKPK